MTSCSSDVNIGRPYNSQTTLCAITGCGEDFTDTNNYTPQGLCNVSACESMTLPHWVVLSGTALLELYFRHQWGIGGINCTSQNTGGTGPPMSKMKIMYDQFYIQTGTIYIYNIYIGECPTHWSLEEATNNCLPEHCTTFDSFLCSTCDTGYMRTFRDPNLIGEKCLNEDQSGSCLHFDTDLNTCQEEYSRQLVCSKSNSDILATDTLATFLNEDIECKETTCSGVKAKIPAGRSWEGEYVCIQDGSCPTGYYPHIYESSSYCEACTK